MSDIDKLMSTLDKIDGDMNDFRKSMAAEVKVAKEGTAKVEGDIAGIQKQLQEFAELAKKGIPPEMKTVSRMMGEAVCKAASEGTDAGGGYTVADELTTEVKSAQNRYGIVRKLFGGEIYPMMSDVTKVPVDTFEDTAGNAPVPAATSENAAITESDDAALSQVTLTAQKYATLNYVSNELIDDSFIDFLGAYLFPKLARKAANTEDGVVLTAASTGLVNTANIQAITMTSGKTGFGDVTADDLYDMQDEIVDDGLENGIYIMHRSILNILRKQKDTTNNYILTPPVGGEPANLCGYGYEKAAKMPSRSDTASNTGFMLFGDITKGCVVGERKARQIVTSKDYHFNYDQTAVRMTWRFAFGTNSNIGRALCRLKTAATAILIGIGLTFGSDAMAQTKYAAGSTSATITYPAQASETSIVYMDGLSSSNVPIVTVQQRVGSPVWATVFNTGTSSNIVCNNVSSNISAADVCIVQHANGTLDYKTVSSSTTTNIAFTAAMSTAVTNGCVIYEMEDAAVYNMNPSVTNGAGLYLLQASGDPLFMSRRDSPVRITLSGVGATNKLTTTAK